MKNKSTERKLDTKRYRFAETNKNEARKKNKEERERERKNTIKRKMNIAI